MSQLRKAGQEGVWFQVAPSGVTVKRTHPDGPVSVFLDLGDLEQLVIDGMAAEGWADHFRETVRDLFGDVAACEVCGSIRGVRATGWENTLLCGAHAASVVEESRRSHGL